MMNIHRQIQKDMHRMIRHKVGNTGDVILKYSSHGTAGTAGDPMDEPDTPPESLMEQTVPLGAFIDASSALSTHLQKFTEIQAGDMILDFPDAISLADKHNLRFIIDGRAYVQKKVGHELSQHFSLRANNTQTTQTLLLTYSHDEAGTAGTSGG